MKLPVKLQELLQQNEQSIGSISTLLAQGNVLLNCTGVEDLTSEQLDLVFSAIPETWDFVELGEVIDTQTLSDTLAERLTQWLDLRLGRVPASPVPRLGAVPTSSTSLDIFQLRDAVVGDYRSYIESFLKIRDPRLQAFVHEELEQGELWPDPLVQLNPSFKRGANVIELVQQGILHPDCSHYFSSKDGQPFTFHYHQEQAFRAVRQQNPYVLTTGTGSGKSMTYVVPIFDDLLRHPDVKGVRAILVYPMNALINSQKEEFDKFLSRVPNSPIRVEQYTGQEDLAKKVEIQNNPPQILLTNYVMLELMLSRNQEEKLVASPDLKFLILDELHTYRGRQGADVAILIRKLRQRCGQELLCIGTSATMSTEGSRTSRRQTVADVASKLFGVAVSPENVIDETLERAIQRSEPTAEALAHAVTSGLPPREDQTLENFKNHPLAAWIEMTFGLAAEDGHLVRRTPISLTAGAEQLAAVTQAPVERCLVVVNSNGQDRRQAL
jgi:hypothetical protein